MPESAGSKVLGSNKVSWAEHQNMFLVSLLFVGIVVVFIIMKFSKKKKAPISLDERQYQQFKLVEKRNVNHNTMAFRFSLPSPSHRLGLPVGRHILVRKPAEEKEELQISRSYTPVTSDDELGYFELVIKIYEKGRMGQFLKHLPVNSLVEMKGPQGHVTYRGHGQFDIVRRDTEKQPPQNVTKTYQIKNVGMIAGGTGLTPMLQIIRDVLKNPADTTKLSFVFANVSEEDIILRDELDRLAERHANFKVYYVIEKPPAGWKGGVGYVMPPIIKDRMPPPAPDSLILVCGPPPMINAQEKFLKELGYAPDHFFCY